MARRLSDDRYVAIDVKERYPAAVEIDGSYADLQSRLGLCYWALAEYEKAPFTNQTYQRQRLSAIGACVPDAGRARQDHELLSQSDSSAAGLTKRATQLWIIGKILHRLGQLGYEWR